jgi:hypothetical protein
MWRRRHEKSIGEIGQLHRQDHVASPCLVIRYCFSCVKNWARRDLTWTTFVHVKSRLAQFLTRRKPRLITRCCLTLTHYFCRFTCTNTNFLPKGTLHWRFLLGGGNGPPSKNNYDVNLTRVPSVPLGWVAAFAAGRCTGGMWRHALRREPSGKGGSDVRTSLQIVELSYRSPTYMGSQMRFNVQG